MSSTDAIDSLITCPGIVAGAPVTPRAFNALARAGMALPESHRALLARANGLTGYGGYFRLLGVAPHGSASADELIDIGRWNSMETWKFAWPSHVAEYLCFGETGWGDQYAYARAELAAGAVEPEVYFLEAITLKPERLASSFDAFLGEEFLRNCRQPYDPMLVEARRALGDLSPAEHITYVPSPLLTGSESIEDVTKMSAVAAMIANGDMATQLGGELQSRTVERIEPYTDDFGRTRLRVVWAGA